MKQNDNYRIVEYLGRYTIQREFTYEEFFISHTKVLFIPIPFIDKKTITKWKGIDEHGNMPIIIHGRFENPPLKSFKSIFKARNYVNRLKRGIIIHKIEE